MEIDRIGVEDVGDAGRYGVVIDRIIASAEDESRNRALVRDPLFAEAEDDECSCEVRSRKGCSYLRDDEERHGLMLDRLFAVADERVYVRRRNRKWAGEMAEAAFLHKAMELGLVVSKPWGDNARYDFVVDTGER